MKARATLFALAAAAGLAWTANGLADKHLALDAGSRAYTQTESAKHQAADRSRSAGRGEDATMRGMMGGGMMGNGMMGGGMMGNGMMGGGMMDGCPMMGGARPNQQWRDD